MSPRALIFICAIATAAGQACNTWYESTQHGPYFRNVKDFGAKGDGVTDDTAAILAAMDSGRTTNFSTKDPAIVYIPAGTYVVTKSILVYFYTHVVGNFACPPTLLVPANTNFNGYVLSADTSDSGDHDDEFYRAVMNLNIVFKGGNPNAGGMHWSVSQATHIRNVTIDMTATKDAGKTGIFGENGSGGFMSDLTILGGQVGLSFGNQQWFFRNLRVEGQSNQCIDLFWDWAFTFVGLTAGNCPVAISFSGGAAGSLLLLDSTLHDTAVGVQTDYPTHTSNLFFERLTAVNVPTITTGLPGPAAGTQTVAAWRQGPWLTAGGALAPGAQGVVPLTRADAPLEQRPRPSFGPVVANAYASGAKGDGVTDDTAALQAAITANAQVFLPSGQYLVSAPLTLRAYSVLVGEVMSMIKIKGSAPVWANAAAPAAVLTAPAGSTVRLADLIFSTDGDDAPGAILLDWNAGSAGGFWDVHWRIESSVHTLLRVNPAAGGYFENAWGWVADHDIDSGAQLTVKSANGFLISSTQPTWWYSTAAEHSANYQFNFSNAQHATVAVAQTETPYWQIPPTAWALTIEGGSHNQIYGTGMYQWATFTNLNQTSVINLAGTDGTSNFFGVNVHGTDLVLSGEYNISALLPPFVNWFCAGFTGFVSV